MDIRSSIVGIVAPEGFGVKFAGTGFLVHDHFILTCAHVVDLPYEIDGKILVQFQGQSQPIETKRIAFSSKNKDDVVVLQVDELPDGVEPLPLVESKICQSHRFIAYGYLQQGEFEALFAKGEIYERVIDKSGREFLQLYSEQVMHGYSGCPVWDETEKAVVGMVTKGLELKARQPKDGHITSDQEAHFGTSFATPTETLKTVHPALLLQESIIQKSSMLIAKGNKTPNGGKKILRSEMVDYNSETYIERSGDLSIITALKESGVTIVVKGSKKMGKSCLLHKAIDIAQKSGAKVIMLDFKLFEHATLTSSDVFFKQFCHFISSKLDVKDTTEKYWAMPLGNTQRCTMYFEAILDSISNDVILAMEDVDKVFSASFETDFFSMLRSWHESRRSDSIWRYFGLILVTSTEPYLYIKDPSRSPFNVGTIIDLEDFTATDISNLNQRFGSPITETEEVQLMELLHGHPYLVNKALYLIRTNQINFPQLLARSVDEEGPFKEHLREQLNNLIGKEELIQSLRQCINSNFCQDEWVFYKLHRAGLVRKEGTSVVVPRCKLYSDYFKVHLHE